ncbi:MAG: FHA domain-containing protein [Aeromicrobium sp.]|uniref:FHA domain-containing protein n=1 Tax=Aeromicrobium sp. TaxID=1871063 RepID=UPI0039E63CAB
MAELSVAVHCRSCGTEYPETRTLCSLCSGSDFAPGPVPADPPPEPEQAAPPEPSAVASPVPGPAVLCCGFPVPPGQAECDYCGEPVGAAVEPEPAAPGPNSGTALVAPDGTRVPLTEGRPVVFGRNPDHSPWARLAAGNLKVSGRHAEVLLHDGRLHVRDLSSTNGTWVRGVLIDGAAVVPVEDGVEIGLSRHLTLRVSQS